MPNLPRYYDKVCAALGLCSTQTLPRFTNGVDRYVLLFDHRKELLAWWDLGRDIAADQQCTFEVAGPLGATFRAEFTPDNRVLEVAGGTLMLVNAEKLHLAVTHNIGGVIEGVVNGKSISQARDAGS